MKKREFVTIPITILPTGTVGKPINSLKEAKELVKERTNSVDAKFKGIDEYWLGILGPARRENFLAEFGDPLPRNGAQEGFAKLVGDYPEHAWTGWGKTKEVVDVIHKITSIDVNSKEFKLIKDILNKK